MRQIIFKTTASQRIYDNYIKRIDRILKSLPKADREDVLKEFNSHIYEGINRAEIQSEVDVLLDVLDRLGPPEESLKPLIADKKLEQATKTFNPVHVLKALALNLTNGFSYIIFAILYIILLGGVFIVYAKLADPGDVGLYFKGDNFLALGRFQTSAPNSGQIKVVLGNWFIPTILFSMVLIYFILTFFLRIKRTLNQKL